MRCAASSQRFVMLSAKILRSAQDDIRSGSASAQHASRAAPDASRAAPDASRAAPDASRAAQHASRAAQHASRAAQHAMRAAPDAMRAGYTSAPDARQRMEVGRTSCTNASVGASEVEGYIGTTKVVTTCSGYSVCADIRFPGKKPVAICSTYSVCGVLSQSFKMIRICAPHRTDGAPGRQSRAAAAWTVCPEHREWLPA